ncbi:MAG: hypothetical protein ABI867_39790 [Kofleriaceae bacterium]
MRVSFGRTTLAVLALTSSLGLAIADQPKKVSGHPNLAAAQKLAAQAYDKLEASQKANEYDLGGHAAKAKDLLKQANAEILLAAQAADAHDGKK